MKKLVSLLLVWMLLCSIVPMTTFAAFDPAQYETTMKLDGKWYGYISGDDGWTDITKEMNAYLDRKAEEAEPVHEPGKHEYSWAHDLKYHWLQCPCGCKIAMEHHVDPKTTTDDYCTCGYHFSSNPDLVTLWLKDCEGLYDFRPDKTEYETNAFTYKDVKTIKKIATRTHSAGATVEIPEDIQLQEGDNKIEIKVTAENQKVTKTYTVIVHKEASK